MIDQQDKTCTRCHQTKARDDFGNHRSKRDGKYSWCRACASDYNRQYREQRKPYWRGRTRQRIANQFGVTAATITQVFEDSDGLCALCYDEPATVIDHDHLTGRIRGAVCHNCNIALGHLKDDVGRVLRAYDYLMDANATAVT
jgi:Autographiviridae endonuclease VII